MLDHGSIWLLDLSMTDAAQTYDPRNLIREAYRIEGISESDCRSIFLDWALGLKDGQHPEIAARALLAHYSGEPADHPMTRVMTLSLDDAAPPRRRGGARARR